MSKQIKGSTILKDGFSLFLVTAIFVLLLAGAYLITRPAIQAYHDAALAESLPRVLPAASDFAPITAVEDRPGIKTYTIGYTDGQPVGVALEVSVAGWNPDLMFLLGLDLNGEIAGIEILSHAETPGIGCAIEEEDFLNRFVGRTAGIVHVPGGQSASGNQIELITGVTISARVMVEGANEALDYFHTTLMPALVAQYDIEAPEIPETTPPMNEDPQETDDTPQAAPPQTSLEGVLANALLTATGASFADTVHVGNDLGILSYTVGLMDGQPIGVFFELSVEGWYPYIVFLLSVDLNGEITDLTIISHRETPDIGDVIERDSFTRQFVGRTAGIELIESGQTAQGNQIVGITGATISVEAVLAGANAALAYFNDNVLPRISQYATGGA